MRKYWTGFFMAWGMFCWIPCPHKIWDEEARSEMLAMLSVHGLFMGLMWYVLTLAMASLALPLPLQALVLALFPFVISGGIHLDGFMDCCDAIKSGRSIEEKQRILKDSHSGAFAVIGLGMVFFACFAAALSLLEAEKGYQSAHEPYNSIMLTTVGKCLPLLMIPCLSRAYSIHDVMSKPPMGHSEYSGGFQEQKKFLPELVISAVSVLAFVVVFMGGCFLAARSAGFAAFCGDAVTDAAELARRLVLRGLWVMVVMGLTVGIFGRYARKALGGMSGDVAGYEIVLAETAALLTLAVV